MNESAQLVYRRERFGLVAEWKGDPRKGVARMDGMTVEHATGGERIRVGQAIKFGGLRLRIVEFPVVSSSSAGYCDVAHVMLDSPLAELRALYVRVATRLLRAVCNLEARVRGFMLQDIHGKRMEFTERLAGKLL